MLRIKNYLKWDKIYWFNMFLFWDESKTYLKKNKLIDLIWKELKKYFFLFATKERNELLHAILFLSFITRPVFVIDHAEYEFKNTYIFYILQNYKIIKYFNAKRHIKTFPIQNTWSKVKVNTQIVKNICISLNWCSYNLILKKYIFWLEFF